MPDGNNEEKKSSKKSAKSGLRDAGVFFAGVATGAGLTVGIGVLTNKVKDIPGLPSTSSSAPAKG